MGESAQERLIRLTSVKGYDRRDRDGKVVHVKGYVNKIRAALGGESAKNRVNVANYVKRGAAEGARIAQMNAYEPKNADAMRKDLASEAAGRVRDEARAVTENSIDSKMRSANAALATLTTGQKAEFYKLRARGVPFDEAIAQAKKTGSFYPKNSKPDVRRD